MSQSVLSYGCSKFTGWNAEAMELNAYHKADGHSDSSMVELRIEVFQDVKVIKEHKVDIEVSTTIGT